MLIVIYDFADSIECSRHSKLLHGLFARGRHNYITTIVSTHKFTAQAPILRSNATHMFVFRLRNYSCLQTLIDELSALIDKPTMLSIYQEEINHPFAFLYINLMASDLNNMFMINCHQVIKISD